MLPTGKSYDEVRAKFAWNLPARYNMGVDVCDKWADGSGRLALIHKHLDGRVDHYSFDQLKTLSNKLANALLGHGVVRGDRVGVLLPQSPETAYSHIAVHKMGGISVPLFGLFGEEALSYRLGNCGARALVTDPDGLAKIAAIKDELPDLKVIFCVTGPEEGALGLPQELDKASADFSPVDTALDDPALIIYTSGTTGQPKGALHGHRALLGHLPGVELPHGLFPQEGDLFWTPADWAWIGGLLDVLMPSLHHGKPVLAYRFPKFDPEETFQLLADFKVRNSFIPPTALKMMRTIDRPMDRHDYNLRSLGSGGESLGAELLDWGRETFGLTMSEFYGQTECNLVVSSCDELMPTKPGSIGRAVPGHNVQIVDNDGQVLPAGTQGNIAIEAPDPVMFLQYWNNPQATADKYVGDWLLTGDQGVMDDEGYFTFVGRDDDVITSGGYRIGPGEIEDCLLRHPAVAMTGVVGIPDALRTERVKAFVVLKEDREGSDDLAKDIQNFVKTRLAAHEYPREVEFVEALPMTTTGKVMRRELKKLG
ncbi:acyl-CoA synthetase [Rhodovibrionaceae bacterium A322]